VLHFGSGRIAYFSAFHCVVNVSEFYIVFLNREKLLPHFWTKFWTQHCTVLLLPCWLLVAEGNQLLLVYLLLEPLLRGNMSFRHTDLFIFYRCTAFLGSQRKIISVGIQIFL
jgi:hypothetical protein